MLTSCRTSKFIKRGNPLTTQTVRLARAGAFELCDAVFGEKTKLSVRGVFEVLACGGEGGYEVVDCLYDIRS